MPPSSIASTRLASGRRSLRWTVKLSGTFSSASLSARSFSAGTAVSTGGLAVRSSSPVPMVVTVGSSYSPSSILRRRSFSAVDISSWRSCRCPLDVLGADDPLADQLLRVDLRDRRVGLDLGRHQRLGVGGLVGLVVAEAAVADQVDDDVAPPALAVGHREADRRRAGLDVVGVDVDDRHVEALRHVGRVGGGAGVLGVGGEAHLVVLDDVDGAAGAVALQRLQVEGLGDDALAGEGGVAVQEDRDGALRVVGEPRALEVGLEEAGGARRRPGRRTRGGWGSGRGGRRSSRPRWSRRRPGGRGGT